MACIDTHTSLVEIDRSCIWHPFTQMQTAQGPIPIVRGKGTYLYTEDGKQILDGISSWWVNLHGHSHPYIVEKIKRQAEELEHTLFAGFTHRPAVEFAARLLPLIPGNPSKIFYSDNGSTAVETALKMAIQYWHNQNPETKKRKVICFRNSYHGDTFGAMSAAGKNGFNRPFWSYLFDVEVIDPPLESQEEHSLSQLQRILKEGNCACFIFEPLILGAGGMIIYSAGGLNSLIQECKTNGVITIADEVMTGFGRTGPLFACEYLKEKPDIFCLSKSITGGFLPLGATVCSEFIYKAFLGSDLQSALLHGHTYTANPLACSSAVASLDLLLQNNCTDQRNFIAKSHRNFCHKWQEHPKLKRCESLGTLLVIEYKTETTSYFQPFRERLYRYFLERGVLLRPLGNVVYVMPPYCIQEEELDSVYRCIILTLEEHS